MRLLSALAVLALLLLAGCTTPGSPSSSAAPTAGDGTGTPEPGSAAAQQAAAAQASEPRPALVDPTVLPEVVVATTGFAGGFVGGSNGPGAAEPNLAIAPDGTLYASNPCQVWRSEDHGKSWKETAHTGQTGCGDGDIALDGAGTLFWFGLGNGGVPFQASTDRGESFSKQVDLSDGTATDREWIDATPAGKVYTTWRGGDGKGASFLEARTSLDGGKTWQAKAKVGADGDEGPVTHDPVTGKLYIPVVDQAAPVDTAQPAVHVYTSTDQGAAWTGHTVGALSRLSPVEPNGYASDFPVIAVDSAGTAYLVYSGPLALPAPVPSSVTPPEEVNLYGIYLQVSHDGGEHWSGPRLVSATDKDARFPWVAAGKPGRVAIAWYENVLGNPGETVPDAWNVRLWESVTADAATPAAKTVTLTSSPNHVGSVCTSGTGCAASDRSLLDYFEIAITAEGQPVAVWSSSALGTGVGVAVKGTDIHFGGLAAGTPLR